jgi:hypothetical protein
VTEDQPAETIAAHGPGDTDDASTEIALAEFQKLRDEVTSRNQLMTTLVVAELTALGTGISVFEAAPDVLLALAGVSCFLWLLWLDHAQQVHRIASYIELSLAPSLRKRCPDVLAWERYVRLVDVERVGACRAPATPASRELRFPKMRSVGYYVGLLFGVSALVLLPTYVFTLLDRFETSESGFVFRAAASGAVFLVLLFAACQFRVYDRTVDAVNKAMLAAKPPGGNQSYT